MAVLWVGPARGRKAGGGMARVTYGAPPTGLSDACLPRLWGGGGEAPPSTAIAAGRRRVGPAGMTRWCTLVLTLALRLPPPRQSPRFVSCAAWLPSTRPPACGVSVAPGHSDSFRLRKEHGAGLRLAAELVDLSNKTGRTRTRRDDMHRAAEANKAYVFFRKA